MKGNFAALMEWGPGLCCGEMYKPSIQTRHLAEPFSRHFYTLEILLNFFSFLNLSRIWNFAWWKYDMERFAVTSCNDYLFMSWGVVLKRTVAFNSMFQSVCWIVFWRKLYSEFSLNKVFLNLACRTCNN